MTCFPERLPLEFFSQQKAAGFPLASVEQVATEFLGFMRKKYDEHYAGSSVPEDFREGPVFLIGGYSRGVYLPAIHRLDVRFNRNLIQFGPGEGGLAWAGQSDAVERLMRGYDVSVRIAVEQAVTEGVRRIRESASKGVEETLQQLVDRIGADKIADMRIALPATDPIVFPWDGFGARISFSDLPLQDAIDFAAYLANIQSGWAKFSAGVATVGGRTHIGLITRDQGFRMINETALTHSNTGFL